jgi:nitroimidazol reductase NimA-like FMN-containing flavoprotein (pyridoxamine 5'-phosphate oxidase superfamily)
MTAADELTRAECLELLGAHRVGRVAITHQALPAIVPVNYVVDGTGVVFRTRPGGLLDRACHSTVVAFEVDEVRPDGTSGSSVLVVGVADALDESEGLRIAPRALASARGDGASRFIRVTFGQVSGRRVGPALMPAGAA